MHLRDEAADRRMAETPSLGAYLPHILAYPLKGHGAFVVVFLAVLLWFGTASILGIALFAIAAPWTFHYFEGVIEQSSLGRATPPIFGGNMIYLGGIRALQPLIGLGIIAASYTLAFNAGLGARLAVLVAGAFWYPAFLLVLAVEGNILAALNPLRAVRTIVAVGPAYLGICVVMVGAVAIGKYAAGTAATFLALLTGIYLAMVVFHMLGYVAFHRHAQLGLLLKVAPPTDESRAMDAQDERLKVLLAKIDASSGSEAASVALYAEPGGPAYLRIFHEELFEQLQVKGQVQRRREPLIHAQGSRLITQLLREKRAARALDIAETCYDFHKDFQPEQPAQAVELAQMALLSKRLGLFKRLTHDAATRYDQDAAAVSLQFLVAKDAYENGGDEARAREILAPLLADEGHPLARQIAAYARALGAATGPPQRKGQ